MILSKLCSPALLYLTFMILHILVQMSKEKYKDALLKLIISVIFTLILQMFCMQNMRVISWLLVFIPIIMYTYTTLIIFFVFGLNPTERVKRYIIT